MAECHGKSRFATREFAEQVITAQRTAANDHYVRARQHRAYFCCECACWHTGHSATAPRGDTSTPRLDTIGRLAHLRGDLVAEYGATQQSDTWRGVRALTGAIRYLQTHP
jgi:hypothetical protein